MGANTTYPDKLKVLALSYLLGMNPTTRAAGVGEPIRVKGPLQFEGGITVSTMTGNLTLTTASDSALFLNPNATPRLVTLPAEADSDGLTFTIVHTGTDDYLRVQDDSPATIDDIAPGEAATFTCDGTTWRRGLLKTDRLGFATTTMSGNVSLTADLAKVQWFAPNGSNRTVTLPAEDASAGAMFLIYHGGNGNTITVQDDSPSTKATLSPGDFVALACDGSAWGVVFSGSATSDDNAGVCAEARLIMSAQPAHQDTIGIGNDTYEFINTGTGTVVASDTNIAVVIGGSAAATRANLIAAINGTATNPHPTVTLADTVTGAVAIGTESFVADEISNDVRIRTASQPGGTAIGGNPSKSLAESITDAADVWRQGNVNVNTLGGQTRARKKVAHGQITVTSAMITSEPFTVASLPFTPTGFTVQVRSSTGLLRSDVTDLFTIANDTIQCNVDGATNVANTNTITYTAWE